MHLLMIESQNSMKYDLLLFDLDNTLICFETAQNRALKKTLEPFFNCDDEFDRLNGRFKKINDELWHSLEKGKLTKQEVFTHRFRMLLKDLSPEVCSGLNEDYLELLAEDPVPLPGARQLIERIPDDIPVILVTNGDKTVQKKKLQCLPFRDKIDYMVISDEVGYSKPSKQIFEFALKQSNRPLGSKVLMTGDNLNADILGALDMGFDACWYNPHKKPLPSFVKPSFEVGHLDELTSVIFN